MRKSSVVCLTTTTLFVSGFTFAQQTPTRDPRAIQVIQQSLAVMGGASAISQISNCVAQGTIQAPPGSWMTSGSLTWETSGTEFRYSNPSPQGTEIFVSGHGQPASTTGGVTVRVFAHVSEAVFPPHLPALVLFEELQDSRYSVVNLGTGTVEGKPALHVQTSLAGNPIDAQVTQQDWYLDPNTGLPLRVEYRLPSHNDALQFLSAAFEFANYQAVSGVLVPFQITIYFNGQEAGVVTVGSVSFNTGLSPSEFDAPSGGAQ
jgi:outer membrane lipoprotein-sorting protein